MTNDGTHSYQWDAEGRLVLFDNGATLSMVYNALGERVMDIQPEGSTTRLLSYPLDIFGHRTEVFDYRPSQNWAGADEFWAQVAGQRILMGGSTSRLRHSDAAGTTTMVTDQTGAVDSDVLYYPWGHLWANYNGSNGNVFGDLQNQVNYPPPPSATRDYNPGIFRWTTPDHLGGDVTNPQSLPDTVGIFDNRYAYALNNPVSNNDPLGLAPCRPGAPNYVNDCAPTDDGTTVDLTSLGNVGVLTPQASENGIPGGGGVGGGGTASSGTAWSRFLARVNCASHFGEEHSIAAGIYAGKGKPDFATNLFLGNAVSAIANLGLILGGERAPTAGSFATHSLIGVGQGIPSQSNVVKGPVGVVQDAAVGAAYTAVRGLNDAPITGITGAALEAGGETAATSAESFAAGVGIAKFGLDALTFGYGLYKGCKQ